MLSLQVTCLLKDELNVGQMKKWFWTDSKVIIGYIRNDGRRFKKFVANRAQKTRENTDVQQ